MKPQHELKTNWIFPLNSTDYAIVQSEDRLTDEHIDVIIENLEVCKRGIQRSKQNKKHSGLYIEND